MPSPTASRTGAAPARASDYVLLWVAPVLFASNNVAARLADGLVPPATLALGRWGLTFVFLLPLVGIGLWRRRAVVRAEAGRLLVLGTLGMGIAGITTYTGAMTTTASNIGLIYGATPALVLLLDWALTRARLTRTQGLGMVVAVVGVVVIVGKGDLGTLLRVAVTAGDLWVTAGAIGWAGYSVLLKYWPSELALGERAAATALAGAAFTLPFAAVEIAAATAPPSVAAIAIVLAVALLAGVGAILAHARLTAALGPRRTVVLLYLIPLYNVALAWLVLGERLAAYQAVAAALILAGVALSTMRPERQP